MRNYKMRAFAGFLDGYLKFFQVPQQDSKWV